MTPGCRKPSFQFMVVFLVCFVNDRVRLRLPCQAPPVAIARAATQRRRRAANKKLQRNATGQATLHAIAQRMKKLASKPVLSAVIKHVMISDITQDIKVANVRLTYLGLRSEARRVGKESVMTCRSRWSQYH